MDMRLLEVDPEELQFIFRLKKICSSSIQLTNNNMHNHVAFKVKTTAPKKFCVRPNKGIIEPKSTCEITVQMQAQNIVPPNMICKDKFLIASTEVPAGTTWQDISPTMFAKDGVKYIEEKKLLTTFVSPSSEALKGEEKKLVTTFFSPSTSLTKEAWKDEEMAVGVLIPSNDKEELKMIKNVEELKLKVTELESKLSQAQVTLTDLEEENRRIKFSKKNRVTLCSVL